MTQQGTPKTQADLDAEIFNLIPDNNIHLVTPYNARQVTLDIVASLGTGGGGGGLAVGSTAITGGTSGRLLFDNAGVLGETTGGGALPVGGTASQIVSMSKAGVGIWSRSESVNVEDFYPPGFATPHNNSSQPLSGIFGSLAAAQAIYPMVDDLTPEVDTCAIQAAIDYAALYNTNGHLSDIYAPAGFYYLSETPFIDPPDSLRGQSTVGTRWTIGATFSSGQTVLYNGVPYTSLQNGNTGHAPRYSLTEDGNDPWWKMYYIDAGPVGSTGAALGAGINAAFNWKPTFRGESGHGAFFSVYGTVFVLKYVNMIAIMGSVGNGPTYKNLSIHGLQTGWIEGGLNPRSAGIIVPGAGGGASGTTIEDVIADLVYSVIRNVSIGGGGLSDNNVVRRCGGGESYRFLSYPNTQAFINSIYDCLPNSTIGASGAPGILNVYGGNWSAFEENDFSITLSISGTSAISTGSGNAYWLLGDQFTPVPHAQYQYISTNITNTNLNSLNNGVALLSNAYQDGRNGNYNWFVINTPSFGPVPFVVRPDLLYALTLFGPLTGTGSGGSGYASGGSAVFHAVPLTGGTSGFASLLVDVTVTAGVVTALKPVYTYPWYTIGETLTTSNTNLGNSGSGFHVLYTPTLNLMIAPHWLDTFLAVASISSTDLENELRNAATTLYAACVSFPFQCAVNADGVFFENFQASTCMLSISNGRGATSIFKSGFLDADPSMAFWGPGLGGSGLLNNLGHYYAQKTIPYIWLNGDVIFDGFSWGSTGGGFRDPLIVYNGSVGDGYKLIQKNTSRDASGTSGPLFNMWTSKDSGGPFYSTIIQQGAGLENNFLADYNMSLPTWNNQFGSSPALIWANNGGKSGTSGIRPSVHTIPSILSQDLNTLTDPQNLTDIISINTSGNLAAVKYSMPYGGTVYKNDFVSPTLFNDFFSTKLRTRLFESSHDFFSYHQNLSAHDGGGPGIVLGLKWTARGQSWCVFFDNNTITLMMPGLVFGIITTGGVPNYYVVTGIYPGLGYVTVSNIVTLETFVTGSSATIYSDIVIYAQPYRIRYLSAPARSVSSATTAVAGEDIIADTSGGSWTLTLPKSPLAGDKVTVYDGASFATHNLVICGNRASLIVAGTSSHDDVKATTSATVTALCKTGATGGDTSTASWVVSGGTLSGTPALLVTPDSNTSFGGQIGGTFFVSPITYTLKSSSATVNWSVSGVPAWLTPSASSGNVNTAGTGITFTVAPGALTPTTPSNPPYTATMTFTNTDDGSTTVRLVMLIILPLLYVAEGDSITTGAGITTGYPDLYGPTFSPATSLSVQNIAVSGSGYNQVISRLPQMLVFASLKRTGDKYVASVMAGTNDATFGYPSYGTLSRNDYLQKFATYLDSLRAAGLYVILCTLISRGGNGGGNNQNLTTINPELIALNAEYRLWIPAGPGGTIAPGHHCDVLCDFAANAHFDPTLTSPAAYTNATYYIADQTHLTATGQALLETIIAPFLNTAL